MLLLLMETKKKQKWCNRFTWNSDTLCEYCVCVCSSCALQSLCVALRYWTLRPKRERKKEMEGRLDIKAVNSSKWTFIYFFSFVLSFHLWFLVDCVQSVRHFFDDCMSSWRTKYIKISTHKHTHALAHFYAHFASSDSVHHKLSFVGDFVTQDLISPPLYRTLGITSHQSFLF